MKSLNLIPSGKEVVVKEVLGGFGFKSRLYGLGIFPGEKIKVIHNSQGPIIIRVGNTKLAIGKGQASKILVEEV